MSQNIWKVKCTKKYCLGPTSVVHFYTQPEGLCGTRKAPGTTAQQVVTLPFIPGQKEAPRGAVCDCPCAGVVAVTAARPPNKSCLKWCSTPPPSCCCCCSWLYCIKRSGATAPFTAPEFGVKKDQKLQRGTSDDPTKASLKQDVLALQNSSDSCRFPLQSDPASFAPAPALSPSSSTDHWEFPGL